MRRRGCHFQCMCTNSSWLWCIARASSSLAQTVLCMWHSCFHDHTSCFLRCSLWRFILHHLPVKEMKCSFLPGFNANATPRIFVLGKIEQKLHMIGQQCLLLSKALVHQGRAGLSLCCHLWYQHPYSPMDFYPLCWPCSNQAGLCWPSSVLL